MDSDILGRNELVPQTTVSTSGPQIQPLSLTPPQTCLYHCQNYLSSTYATKKSYVS